MIARGRVWGEMGFEADVSLLRAEPGWVPSRAGGWDSRSGEGAGTGVLDVPAWSL